MYLLPVFPFVAQDIFLRRAYSIWYSLGSHLSLVPEAVGAGYIYESRMHTHDCKLLRTALLCLLLWSVVALDLTLRLSQNPGCFLDWTGSSTLCLLHSFVLGHRLVVPHNCSPKSWLSSDVREVRKNNNKDEKFRGVIELHKMELLCNHIIPIALLGSEMINVCPWN